MDDRELKWDRRFLKIAESISEWSKDPSTKVGCIAVKDRKVIATGYNGFPVNISELKEYPKTFENSL